jgi:hypothetical protein
VLSGPDLDLIDEVFAAVPAPHDGLFLDAARLI